MFCLFIVLAVSPIQAVTIDDGVSSGVHYGQPDHPSSLVFIDAGVRDKQLLLSSMAENTKAIILRHDSDGVQQITDALQEYRRLESIQIISHGTPGQLMLGSTSLTGANLHRYQYDLQTWGDSLKPQGGILLYGCNVAQGAAGDRFVDRISNFTGAPIAASTDITGSTHLGGNWVLEKRTETIVVTSAIGEPALSLYNHLLAPPGDGSYDVSDTFSTPAGTTRTGVGGYPTNTQWDSTWSSLTYDGGPIDTWITGIARLGSGFGDYIDIADAGYTTNTDANTHWFRVTADNVNAASFELTDIVLQNYLGSDNFDVTVTGYRVGGGTVQATTTYASAAAGSISSVLGPFSGVQITSFDLAFSTSNSSPIGDFTFVSFGIANAAAPVTTPTVTGISPSSGPTTGSTSVTITGSNFTGTTGVTIGGSSATGVTVVNDTTITATTPAGTVGAKDVVVTNASGSGTGTGLFTYVAAPTVTGISPSSGPATGGTSVTITGTNLTGATSVTIGGASATSVSVVNSTTITATTPSGTPGARDVAVTTVGGTGTGTGLFTYIAAPTVTGITPSSGPTAGGTNVTITGTNLTGATGVTIGGASATSVSVVNSTTITATTPSGTAGARDVAVTTVGGTGTGTGLFTYIAAPTVTNISPDYGATTGSTSVTITGTNLTGATSVTIGGASATGVSVVNSTTITATTPAGTAGARDVAVTTVGGTGTGTGIFTYIAAPTVTGISPSSGPTTGGDSVTITGTSFTGTTSVTIGGSAATGVAVVNDTTITATTPAGTAGAKDVIVTNSVGSGTGTSLYTYVAAPTVTGISPASGTDAGGTGVTITGTNLTGATGVTIGGSAATGITVINSTTITATTPAGTAGARDVTVTTIGGTGTGTGLFTYLSAPGAPTGATASGGDTQATVNFTAPTSDGGSTITTYTATSSPGGLTGTCAGPAACAITVTGLTNGTVYNFTVTATNAIGTSAPSAASNSVTPAAGPTVPDAPTSVTATAGYGQATINFSAPASDGGSAITIYTATSSPGGLTGTCTGPTACAITVTGLTGGTAYTFTVTATNAVGTGAASVASNSVTVVVRPDPTQDADVIGLVDAQARTANRFWRTQTSNYHQRLESLHHATRKRSASADTLLMKSDSLSLATDSESFAGAGRGRLQSMVVHDPAARIGDDIQPEGNDIGSELLMPGIALAKDIANALNTSSLNINLAAFDYGLESSAGDVAGFDIWGAGNVRIGKRESHDGSSKIDYSTDGVTFGIDHWFSDNLLLGMGIGYAHDDSEIGSNGSENTSDGKSIALYASYQPGDSMFIDGVLGYGILDMDSSRYDTLTDSTAYASRDGEQLFGSIAVGYEYLNESTLISPYARYDIAVSRLDSATETGAGIGSLNYADQTYTSKQISLGLRAGFQHKTDSYLFQPRARIEYQHHIEGGDDASIAYADTLSTRYNMAIPSNNSNSLLLGVGSSFVLRNGLNLDIDYQWSHSNDDDDSQAIFLRVSMPLGGD